MSKSWAYGALAGAGLGVGAVVARFFSDCHESICWPGLSPFFLMLLAGFLSPWLSGPTSGKRFQWLRRAAAAGFDGALTGMFVTIGGGLVMLLEARPYCCGPRSLWSPVVLTAYIGAILGLVGGSLYGATQVVRMMFGARRSSATRG